MIVDSSPILSAVFGEPGFEVFAQALADAQFCKISAASFVEVRMVAEGEERPSCRGSVAIMSVTVEHGYLAVQGFSNYRKGKHAAGLNFADCFSYALAKALDEPWLFPGEGFRKADVIPAIA